MKSDSIFKKLLTFSGWRTSRSGTGAGDRGETETLFRKSRGLSGVFNSVRSASPGRPAGFYRDMIAKLADLFPCEVIGVLVPDAGRRMYVPFCTNPDHEMNGRWSVSEDDEIVYEFLRGRQFACSVGPCLRYGDLPGRDVSCCHFPIKVNDRIEAILFLAARNLAASDVEMISGFCRDASVVVQNQKMYQDLSGRLQHAASIADALTSFTRAQNEKELLRTILDKSSELLRAEQGSLIVVDQQDQALLLKAKKGVVKGFMEGHRMKPGEGISGRVVELGEPMLVENLENDPRMSRKNRYNYRTSSFVSVPIRIENRIIGVINLADKSDGSSFTENDLSLMQSIASQAAIVMERNQLQNQVAELKKLSTTDPLTGLLNRRYILDRASAELARSERRSHEMSLLMLDLDGFKECNDRLGHLFGDKILVLIAEILLHAVRSMDAVARYGGDEFLILLPETTEVVAGQIAERIRQSVEAIALSPEAALTGVRLSTSIGMVCYPFDGKTMQELLSNADAALYRAKRNGKNRVESIVPPQ